jgi:hypothetical protein
MAKDWRSLDLRRRMHRVELDLDGQFSIWIFADLQSHRVGIPEPPRMRGSNEHPRLSLGTPEGLSPRNKNSK